MSALLFWAMFFLVIAYGPSSLPGLRALHAVQNMFLLYE